MVVLLPRGMCADKTKALPSTGPNPEWVKVGRSEKSTPLGSVKRHNTNIHATQKLNKFFQCSPTKLLLESYISLQLCKILCHPINSYTLLSTVTKIECSLWKSVQSYCTTATSSTLCPWSRCSIFTTLHSIHCFLAARAQYKWWNYESFIEKKWQVHIVSSFTNLKIFRFCQFYIIEE